MADDSNYVTVLNNATVIHDAIKQAHVAVHAAEARTGVTLPEISAVLYAFSAGLSTALDLAALASTDLEAPRSTGQDRIMAHARLHSIDRILTSAAHDLPPAAA